MSKVGEILREPLRELRMQALALLFWARGRNWMHEIILAQRAWTVTLGSEFRLDTGFAASLR